MSFNVKLLDAILGGARANASNDPRAILAAPTTWNTNGFTVKHPFPKKKDNMPLKALQEGTIVDLHRDHFLMILSRVHFAT